jgi:predicted Zn-dependent protease
LKDYNKVIAFKPDETNGYNNRGYTYIRLDKTALAFKDFDTVLKLEPENATAFYHRTVAYYHLKKYKKALKYINREFAIAKNKFAVRKLRASILFANHKIDAAIADLAENVKQHPKDPESVLLLGLAYSRAKDQSRASQTLKQACLFANAKTIKSWQKKLARSGMYKLSIDGVCGHGTYRAFSRCARTGCW